MTSIDWIALATRLGTLNAHGESGGDHIARRALVEIVGEDAIVDAVEHYLSGQPGAELARSVLWLLQAPRSDGEVSRRVRTRRRSSATSIRSRVAPGDLDARALDWIEECWRDPDADIQNRGASMLDQLLFRNVVDAEAAEPLITAGETHANAAVRESMRAIRQWLAAR